MVYMSIYRLGVAMALSAKAFAIIIIAKTYCLMHRAE